MHKFSCENTYPNQLSTKVEFTIPSDADLTDMLEQFELYLKAVGFSFDGNVDIVPVDEYGNYGENNPPVGESKKKLWDATPEEWNAAAKWTQDYTGTGQYVNTTYNVQEPVYVGKRAK